MVNTSAIGKITDRTADSAYIAGLVNPFRARYATDDDGPSIDQIVREAFGQSAPKSSAAREMKRKNMTYIVATRDADAGDANDGLEDGNGWQRRLKSIISVSVASLEPQRPSNDVVGLVGVWTPVDQAHIVVIATRPNQRGKGIGELLLLATLSEALKIDAENATLEVRKSNEVARALYRKYGFSEVGIRRRYYQDNREDAIIMSTPNLSNLDYRRSLRSRCKAYFSTRGKTHLQFDPLPRLTLP